MHGIASGTWMPTARRWSKRSTRHWRLARRPRAASAPSSLAASFRRLWLRTAPQPATSPDFLTMALDNALTKPGAATIMGTPVDLSKVDADSYVVAGLTDHLCPWQSCYRSTQLLGGEATFVLSTSGHIASMVNPPTNPKSSFQTAPSNAGNPEDPRAWLAAAQTSGGSWWPHYSSWLAARSGPARKARAKPGRKGFPVLAEAPGTYVYDH